MQSNHKWLHITYRLNGMIHFHLQVLFKKITHICLQLPTEFTTRVASTTSLSFLSHLACCLFYTFYDETVQRAQSSLNLKLMAVHKLQNWYSILTVRGRGTTIDRQTDNLRNRRSKNRIRLTLMRMRLLDAPCADNWWIDVLLAGQLMACQTT